VAIGHKNVAIRRDDNVTRPAEGVGALGCDTGLPQRHEQLSILAELEHLMPLPVLALGVGDPDIALAIDGHAVRLHEHVSTEALHHFTGARETEEGGLVSMEHPEIPLAIGLDRNHAAKADAGRKLRPALDKLVGVV